MNICMNIFVGNLAYTTTEAELSQLFEAYGVVRRVQIMQDRETGRPRGFGFVEMPTTLSRPRPRWLGCRGHPWGGRTLTINEARQREDRGGPRRDPRRPR